MRIHFTPLPQQMQLQLQHWLIYRQEEVFFSIAAADATIFILSLVSLRQSFQGWHQEQDCRQLRPPSLPNTLTLGNNRLEKCPNYYPN